ncbi:MAG: preprotein translocase subunit SecG [Bacteroidales bacterium]|nr:preprotein translocase subunit SecG [Bacteroidales bacterium]
MNTLFTVLAILVLIASIFLTIVVLLQNGKGGGLASNFVAGNQTFGVRQTADLLEKVTWGLAAFILILSIFTNFAHSNNAKNGMDITDDIQVEQTEEAPAFPSAPIQQETPAQE